jgi:diguanylate cyclase (GGDEF)-like protein
MNDALVHGTGPARVNPDNIFRALYSFSGLSTATVVILGVVSVAATGLVEWATKLPLPDDVVFVLIVGGVTFHGSKLGGVALAFLAGLARFVSTGWPAARTPAEWSIAAVEGVALLVLLLGIVVLARALHRAIGALQDQAVRDPLTGTLNTRGFMDIAERERLRALRMGLPLTIFYFDVDGLKTVNDASGHQAGDRLLIEFVSAVAESIRPYDILARVGGDEFALILPATDRPAALRVVTRIRDQLIVKQPPPSVSVGAVTYSKPTDSVEDMLKAADDLMYRAKRAGGNRLVGEERSAESQTGRQIVELATLVEQSQS